VPLTTAIAEQIATLINTQNELTVTYTAAKVLRHEDRYIVRADESGNVVGVVEVKNVQWYQCEVDHLSVSPKHTRQGIGSWLLEQAETRAKELGARVAQCTIRVGNVESEGLFKKYHYAPAVTFRNERSGNDVTVYQKVLVAADSPNRLKPFSSIS
jgi:GNAT superfamily N-acetyltransferase